MLNYKEHRDSVDTVVMSTGSTNKHGQRNRSLFRG